MPKRAAPWIRNLCRRYSPCWLLAGTSLCALAQPAPGVRDWLEVSSDPGPLPLSTSLRVDVTHWMSTGPSSQWGLSIGMATQTHTAIPAPAIAAAEPIWEPTLGVRWRTQLGGNMHLDLSTWARVPYRSQLPSAMDMVWLNRQPNYGTRVEVQWRAPRMGGLMPEFGAIGVKLEGDSQLLLRARSGGPMLYYRTRF